MDFLTLEELYNFFSEFKNNNEDCTNNDSEDIYQYFQIFQIS